MSKINNKGFTLIELIATIVLLVLVMGVGVYSITSIVKRTKEKDYELLIKEIKNASELYYQECKYGDSSSDIINGCDKLESGVTLGKLVEFGYLTGNDKYNDGEHKYMLVNPNDGKSITGCKIKIKFVSGKIKVTAVSPSGSCPTSY